MSPEPTPHDFSLLEHLFNQALALPSDERIAFLREKCGEDTSLLTRLKTLLAAHESEEAASESHQRVTCEPLRLRFGAYEVESLLGRGGMGAVYLAHRADGQYEKKVAIKIIDMPLATEAFLDRFRQERQILAGLDHPNIARLLDGGISDKGILFLVMEYVQGTRVDDYCLTHQLALEKKLQLFIAICGAVQFAHQNMVVHRDLKPDNILVSEDSIPHLLDFGTAKLIARDLSSETRGLTREGFLSFTPEYASPEQVLGRPAATTTDTYSLGVVLYRMLTGRLPYELQDFSTEEMIRIICERPIDRPTLADGKPLNTDLEAILTKALRKEPEERYQTADQFAVDVQAYIDNKPVLARKGSLRYRVGKFARRNRLPISFAAVLTFTLLAGLAGVLWQSHQARLAERSSEASATELSQLSDTLLSELDDVIKELPGSTGAQHVLVQRVLDHLDPMAKDHRNSPLIQVSLVNAFVRLANLQANPYEQNLGDTAGALDNLRKAMAIAEPLAKSRPKDPVALLALARAQDARGEILSFADDNVGAAQSLEASTRTYDQLLATPASSPALLFEAGSVIDTLGDVMGQDTGFSDAEAALHNYQRAIEFDQRALAIDPNFMPSRRGLVTMQMKIGNVELDTAPAAALHDFQGALQRQKTLPQAEQTRLAMTRTRALLLRKQAFALCELDRYVEATPLFQASTSIYQKIADSDPKDVRALRDMDRLLTNETFCAGNKLNPLLATSNGSHKGDVASAETLEAQRLETLEKLHEISPKDDAVRQELASVTIRLDSLKSLASSASPDMRERDRESLKLLKEAAANSKAPPLQLDMAFHACMEASPSSLRDVAAAVQYAERGVAMTHSKDPSWLLALAEASQASGDKTRARASAAAGLALLPNEAQERDFRLRKLLAFQITANR